MNLEKIEKSINEAFKNKDKIDSSDKTLSELVGETIELLDNGKIRVAEKKGDKWQVNQWIKKAILLSFRVNKMKASQGPYSTWYDKVVGKTQGWSEEKIKKAKPEAKVSAPSESSIKALKKQNSPKQISSIRNKKISEIIEKRG